MAHSTAELFKADREYLIHPLHHPVDADQPLICVSGRDSSMTDIAGREYLDGLSGLWNVNVGHGRDELAEAAAAQMRELAYCSGFVGLSNVPSIELAERLVDLAGGDMRSVFFVSTGAEANEAAFKTVRFYWKALGRPDKIKIVARQQSYHGLTLHTMSATGMGTGYWRMFEPRVPGFVHVPTCYPYRCQGAKPGETAGQTAARQLEEEIVREGPETIAAFIGEPIHGAGSLIFPDDDYWPRVREICTRHDILLIADEIITGFCRTGRWFGMEHWNVRPDIISFAKGVTSGYQPLGGIIVNERIRSAMDSVAPGDRWMHASTYSGHPTCCAVGLKNLDIMEREGLAERSALMGTRLYEALEAAFGDHPNVGEVRGGKGLLAAVELVEDRTTQANFPADRTVAARIRKEMLARGVITRTRPSTGAHPELGDVIFFAPPLVVTEEELDRFVEVARDATRVVLGA